MRLPVLAALTLLAAGGASAQPVAPTIATEGNWELKRAAENAADPAACVLTPKQQSRIRVDRDRLVVTGLPKNSIFNYQYRIDDKPASTPAMPSAAMQNDGVIVLDGDAFNAIVDAKRFQIRILDRWHEALTEDVDLAGLRGLHQKMIADCK